MTYAVQMLLYFAYYLITAVQLAMLARVIVSILMPDGENALIVFLYAITEPFVTLTRRLFDKLNIGSGGFLDAPFFASYLLLMLLKAVFRALL